MSKIIELEQGNFIADKQVYLVRCPKCNKENYSMNVATGICTWCGFNGNEYYKDKLSAKNK